MVRDKNKIYAEVNEPNTALIVTDEPNKLVTVVNLPNLISTSPALPNTLMTSDNSFIAITPNKSLGTNASGTLVWYDDIEYSYGLIGYGNEYIDVEVPLSNNIRVDIDCKLMNGPAADSTMFGGRSAQYDGLMFWLNNGDGLPFVTFRYGLNPLGQSILTDYSRAMYSTLGRNLYKNDVLISSGTASGPVTTSTPLILFGLFSQTIVDPRRFKGTIYSTKIWDNDVLRRHFVPVKMGQIVNWSMVAPSNCMYDKVSNTFYENKGTGRFGIDEQA